MRNKSLNRLDAKCMKSAALCNIESSDRRLNVQTCFLVPLDTKRSKTWSTIIKRHENNNENKKNIVKTKRYNMYASKK